MLGNIGRKTEWLDSINAGKPVTVREWDIVEFKRTLPLNKCFQLAENVTGRKKIFLELMEKYTKKILCVAITYVVFIIEIFINLHYRLE